MVACIKSECHTIPQGSEETYHAVADVANLFKLSTLLRFRPRTMHYKDGSEARWTQLSSLSGKKTALDEEPNKRVRSRQLTASDTCLAIRSGVMNLEDILRDSTRNDWEGTRS